MEGTSTLNPRHLRRPAGYALVEILVELATAAALAAGRRLQAAAENRRRAIGRRELALLSDRALRDIGLTREAIERMYR